MAFMQLSGRHISTIAALLMLPLLIPAGVFAAAQTEFSETVAACSTVSERYVVEMEAVTDPSFSFSYPSSILLHFETGPSVTVSMSPDSTFTLKRYVLDDLNEEYQQIELLWASAVVDTATTTFFRFEVVAFPCTPITPTGTISGVVKQHGSLKPIEGVTVCVQPMNFCGVTDINGEFLIAGVVPSGNYELVSTGPKLRDLATAVVVDQTHEYYEIIQRRGGGQ